MHNIDLILIILFIVSMIYCYRQGFISTILTWVGLIISLFLLMSIGPMIKENLILKFGISELFSIMLTILLIFMLIAILISILKLTFNSLVKLLRMTFLNRVFGAVLGFVNVLMCLLIILVLIDIIPFIPDFDVVVNESSILKEVDKVKDFIQKR